MAQNYIDFAPLTLTLMPAAVNKYLFSGHMVLPAEKCLVVRRFLTQ